MRSSPTPVAGRPVDRRYALQSVNEISISARPSCEPLFSATMPGTSGGASRVGWKQTTWILSLTNLTRRKWSPFEVTRDLVCPPCVGLCHVGTGHLFLNDVLSMNAASRLSVSGRHDVSLGIVSPDINRRRDSWLLHPRRRHRSRTRPRCRPRHRSRPRTCCRHRPSDRPRLRHRHQPAIADTGRHGHVDARELLLDSV